MFKFRKKCIVEKSKHNRHFYRVMNKKINSVKKSDSTKKTNTSLVENNRLTEITEIAEIIPKCLVFNKMNDKNFVELRNHSAKYLGIEQN